MSISFGNKNVKEMYFGNKKVAKVYFGNKLVWPNAGPTPVGPKKISLDFAIAIYDNSNDQDIIFYTSEKLSDVKELAVLAANCAVYPEGSIGWKEGQSWTLQQKISLSDLAEETAVINSETVYKYTFKKNDFNIIMLAGGDNNWSVSTVSVFIDEDSAEETSHRIFMPNSQPANFFSSLRDGNVTNVSYLSFVDVGYPYRG